MMLKTNLSNVFFLYDYLSSLVLIRTEGLLELNQTIVNSPTFVLKGDVAFNQMTINLTYNVVNKPE